MSLTLVNNNYNGDLIGQLATLLTIGSTDLELFHVMQTRGRKLHFPYATVATAIQTFTSICAVTDQGGRSREIIDVELVSFVMQETACYDEEFDTDYANANDGYESQYLSDQIAEWARMHIDNFSFGLQNIRWSGDTTSSDATLQKHDGVVKLVQAAAAYNVTTNPAGYHKVTTTTVTASNAIQEIGKVIDAVPQLWVKQNKNFKIVISPTIYNFLQQQLRNAQLTVGLNALPKLMLNETTGQVASSDYFGAPIYVAYGLDAVTANQNVIMAGVFADDKMGVLKYATNKVDEDKTLTVKEILDGDAVRLRAISSQNVAVIPDLSQMAMNA